MKDLVKIELIKIIKHKDFLDGFYVVYSYYVFDRACHELKIFYLCRRAESVWFSFCI